jgi:hypothetical protein
MVIDSAPLEEERMTPFSVESIIEDA